MLQHGPANDGEMQMSGVSGYHNIYGSSSDSEYYPYSSEEDSKNPSNKRYSISCLTPDSNDGVSQSKRESSSEGSSLDANDFRNGKLPPKNGGVITLSEQDLKKQQILKSLSTDSYFLNEIPTKLPDDVKDISNIINSILQNAQCANVERKKRIYRSLFEKLPYGELHVHHEGLLGPKDIKEVIEKYHLVWDSKRGKLLSKKRNEFKLPFLKKKKQVVDMNVIVKDFCVSIPHISINRDQNDKNVASRHFDKTFGPRGNLFDEVPLFELLLLAMKKACKDGVRYRELMFGSYPIPVPQSFKDHVEKFHTQMNKSNITSCINFLSKKRLTHILNRSEVNNFKSTLKKIYHGAVETHFNQLKNLSYKDAFVKILSDILSEAETKISKEINRTKVNDKQCKIDPKIFDARSAYTLKLIFEVMRHYSLGEFFAWAFVAFSMIEKDNSKIVGITIDGPQKNSNSIKYFDDHMDIIKELRKLYPKALLTIHALELSPDEFENIGIDHELPRVLEVANRIGHATMSTNATNYLANMETMRKEKKSVEICLTTAHVTTGLALEELPLTSFLYGGVAVILSTDDPGIVCIDGSASSVTNMFKELIYAIEVFKLSWEDIETMTRSAVEFSFLSGNSIYDLDQKKFLTTGKESGVKLVYNLKDSFKKRFTKSFGDFNWKKCIEYYMLTGEPKTEHVTKSLESLNLTSKEIKECHIEMLLDTFKHDIINNLSKFENNGFLPT